jgi:hypothetical protein
MPGDEAWQSWLADGEAVSKPTPGGLKVAKLIESGRQISPLPGASDVDPSDPFRA